MRKKSFTVSRLLAAITLAIASSGALAYDKLVIFGDSLSDSGNNAIVLNGSQPNQVITGNTYVPSHPYAMNAYTNGLTWVNSFAAGLGLPSGAVPSLMPGGMNYAFGGARTTVNGSQQNFPYSAATQVGMFLQSGGSFSADSLAVVAVGGNDVRATAEAVALDPANAATLIGSAAAAYASGVGSIVDSLQAAGAQHIVVWNTPNVGRTPAALANGPQAAAGVTGISLALNGALAARLAGEQGVMTFDVFNAFTPVFLNPGAYGFTNTTDACGAAVNNCDPATAVFWDGIHPTSAAHGLIAQAMLAQVTPVPEVGSALMLSGGLAALWMVRRRRAVPAA